MTDKHVSVTLMNTSMTYVVNGGWVKAAELSAPLNKGDNIKCDFDRDYIDEVVDEELTNMNDDVYPNEEFVTSVIGKIINDDLGNITIDWVDETEGLNGVPQKVFWLSWCDSKIDFRLTHDGNLDIRVDGKDIPVPQSMSVDDCFGEIKKRIVTLIPF